MARGPVEVEAACEAALVELSGAFPTSAVSGSLEAWAGVVGSLQRVIDVASAAQDAAIARLAAIEPEFLEDGTIVQAHRGLGHVALDAPAIVSGVLSVSAVHAQRRVRAAVALAADGPAGGATETGLGGLHAAMASGRLDAYRAGVLAEELEHAPAAVAATVVAALEGHFAIEDGTHLRRRCRRVLTRISPDLLHQRAARARAQCGLRRWADEPGVDRWEGTFPSEEASRAWAAIDALAHQYVTDSVCSNIERARAQALTDLVAGNATIDTVITVTVPATAVPATTVPVAATTGGGDLVEVTGPGAGEPVLVSQQWLSDTINAASTVQVASCHPVTGALLDDDTAQALVGRDEDTDSSAACWADSADTKAGAVRAATSGDTAAADRDAVGSVVAAAAGSGADPYRPPTRTAKRVRARDRRCRFPGCSITAVFCDLDHAQPWPRGRTRDDNLLCLCRRHHRVKQRPGWHLALTPDAVATWTDPTGRTRTTHPVDALRTTILTGTGTGTGTGTSTGTGSTSRARTLIPDGPHSELEFLLEHHGAAPPPPPRPPVTVWRDDHGRRHRTDLLPPTATLVLDHDAWPGRRARHPRQYRATDLPPF